MKLFATTSPKYLNWSRVLFWFFLTFLILSSALSSISLYRYISHNTMLTNMAKQQALEETKKAAKKIDQFLSMLPTLVNTIASEFSVTGVPTAKMIEEKIKRKAINVTGIGVALAPFTYGKKQRLYAPYFVERNGKQELVNLESFYDYTLPQYTRYSVPIRENKGVFLEPFFDPATNTIVAEYSVPFYDLNLKPIGVVFANHSTEHIHFVLEGLQLGKKGYGFVISSNGTYVSHPNNSLARNLKTIFEVAKEMENVGLEKMAQRAVTGESGYIDHKNVATGQESWIFFEPIPSAGWSIATVFVKDEIELDTLKLQEHRIQIFFGFLLSLLLLLFLIIRLHKGGTRRLWIASLLFSLIMIVGVIFMWMIAMQKTFYATEQQKDVAVYDSNSLTKFLQTVVKKKTPTPTAPAPTVAAPTPAPVVPQPTAPTAPTVPTAPVAPIAAQPTAPPAPTAPAVSQQVTIPIAPAPVAPQPTAPPVPTAPAVSQQVTIPIAPAPVAPQPTAPPVPAAPAVSQPSTVPIAPAPVAPQPTAPPTPTEPTAPAAPVVVPQPPAQPTQDHSTMTHVDAQDQQAAPAVQSTPATATKGEHATHGAAAVYKSKKPLHIPTGIYIERLKFVGKREIEIVGHIWQRYHQKKHAGLEKGIVFPQASTIQQWRLKEVYRYDSNEWEVIGWNFRYVLGQPFSYDEYPFDSKVIQIQLWPQDFDKPIMLVPDFDAYKVMNPTSLPGIDPDIPLPSWTLGKSYFSFRQDDYNTNFGFYISGPFGTKEQKIKGPIPDLYFNITANRHIASTLLIDLFPLIIVMIILFITVMMASRGKLEFSSVLGICTSFFFSVIIAHLRFKGTLPTPDVVFFEYFYFILHFTILTIALITIFYFLKIKIWFIAYKEMLIPRLLYWPVISALVLILSITYFY